jgi:hypothetical protein
MNTKSEQIECAGCCEEIKGRYLEIPVEVEEESLSGLMRCVVVERFCPECGRQYLEADGWTY